MGIKDNVYLLNGRKMPLVGLGTWQSSKGEVGNAIKVAIQAGYRHIDTAQGYQNEAEIGAALAELIKDGKVKREEVFLTTKLAPAAMATEHVRRETELSLKNLGTSYIDLYLIHCPMALSDEGLQSDPPNRWPFYGNGALKTSFIDPLDTWREMEKLVDDGLVKAIGLSNFSKEQVKRIWDAARIKPTNLQVECHAWFPQYDLVEFCRLRGISVAAYAPIGSPTRPDANDKSPILMEDPLVLEMAAKYKKTPAQVLLRNLMQRGIVVLPKSVTPDRIISNFQVWDFELSDDDMERFKAINRESRLFTFKFVGYQNVLHPFFPWTQEVIGSYRPGLGLPQQDRVLGGKF